MRWMVSSRFPIVDAGPSFRRRGGLRRCRVCSLSLRRNLAERLAKLAPQQGKVPLDPAVTPDQNMIGPGDTTLRQQFTRQSPQPPFHAVPDDGVADLLGDGEADSHRIITIIAGAHEQDESRHRRALPRIRREKIAAFIENS